MALLKCLKYTMVRAGGSLLNHLRILKAVGFDGVELDSPGGPDKGEAAEASAATGLAIPGIIDSTHWTVRHSDPDAAVRARALEDLKTALRDAKRVGASTVLLVPGRVNNDETENHQQVWDRSIEQVRAALPLAAELGVRIGIENVGNGFCKTPEEAASYIDAIASPWVGHYFDIGNHRRFGPAERWVEVLGTRIIKVDVKDYSEQDGTRAEIGEGLVDWPAMREALEKIKYSGWVSAEVPGGGRERLAEISRRMDQYLLGR